MKEAPERERILRGRGGGHDLSVDKDWGVEGAPWRTGGRRKLGKGRDVRRENEKWSKRTDGGRPRWNRGADEQRKEGGEGSERTYLWCLEERGEGWWSDWRETSEVVKRQPGSAVAWRQKWMQMSLVLRQPTHGVPWAVRCI